MNVELASSSFQTDLQLNGFFQHNESLNRAVGVKSTSDRLQASVFKFRKMLLFDLLLIAFGYFVGARKR